MKNRLNRKIAAPIVVLACLYLFGAGYALEHLAPCGCGQPAGILQSLWSGPLPGIRLDALVGASWAPGSIGWTPLAASADSPSDEVIPLAADFDRDRDPHWQGRSRSCASSDCVQCISRDASTIAVEVRSLHPVALPTIEIEVTAKAQPVETVQSRMERLESKPSKATEKCKRPRSSSPKALT